MAPAAVLSVSAERPAQPVSRLAVAAVVLERPLWFPMAESQVSLVQPVFQAAGFLFVLLPR